MAHIWYDIFAKSAHRKKYLDILRSILKFLGDTIYCPHFDEDMHPESLWCSICAKGSSHGKKRSSYANKVLQQAGRPRVGQYTTWYPYKNSPPAKAGRVHICGGWGSEHLANLVSSCQKLYVVELAPCQEFMIDDGWLRYLYNQPGGAIGVELRKLK